MRGFDNDNRDDGSIVETLLREEDIYLLVLDLYFILAFDAALYCHVL
jgi:hypothetical protein